MWPVFLTGAYALTKRKEKIADEEQRHAVAEGQLQSNAAESFYFSAGKSCTNKEITQND